MRVTVQHVLGLSDERYQKYLADCEKEGITPLKLVDELNDEEYATYSEYFESLRHHIPPYRRRFNGSDADKKFAEHIENYMMKHGNPRSLLSRQWTEQEGKMYERTRLKVIEYNRKQQNLMLQQQQTQQVQYFPASTMANPGYGLLGQSLGEASVGIDF